MHSHYWADFAFHAAVVHHSFVEGGKLVMLDCIRKKQGLNTVGSVTASVYIHNYELEPSCPGYVWGLHSRATDVC